MRTKIVRGTLLAMLVVAAGCDRAAPPPPPAEDVGPPPAWVVEANERSARQAAGIVDDEPQPAAAGVEKLMKYPYLWKVTGKDGKASHLLGSFAVNTDFKGLDPLPTSVREAFEASKTIIIQADKPDLGKMNVEAMFTRKDTGLRAKLNDAEWKHLLKLTESPADALVHYRPWVITWAAKEELLSKGERGMDRRFVILSRVHDKKFSFLESFNEMAPTMDQLVTTDHVVDLLRNTDDILEEHAAALAVFREGRSTSIADFLPLGRKEELTERERKLFLHDRNKKWVESLTPRFTVEGGLFVVVGVGHLLGDGSVPDLLSQNPELKIERIDAAPAQ